MIYIDFDGVILDTEELLFEEWRKNPDRFSLPESEKIKYIQQADWNFIVYNSPIINDSIYYLSQMDPSKSFILTKIHSQDNEGYAKIKWLREMGVKQGIYLNPHLLKKTDIVDAYGNILIDDSLRNLKDWENSGGSPIFFDIDDDNIDTWQQPNTYGYQRVRDLSKI